jgi:maltooligosyltrehalose trehalohydrolase
MRFETSSGIMAIDTQKRSRRIPIGAEVLGKEGVDFRVWAPRAPSVQVVIEGETGRLRRSSAFPLDSEGNGYFSGMVPTARNGMRYRYRLDGEQEFYPDPASRFQPDGPHGPSQVVDPGEFRWTDGGWSGIRLEGQVMYEMHIGTFATGGNWKSAMRELPELAKIGITLLEIMPVADFVGRFGWGYDGVNLFAPTRLYGEPDDFRRFVDRAHALGLGVILDVVYNHLGPDGNYLGKFSKDYFTSRYTTDWGEAINYHGKNSGPVREFFIANAGYWIDEFHVDGLRLDATQDIYDQSNPHIISEVSRRVRAAARGRSTIIVAENEPQEVRLVRPIQEGGCGIDAVWNDDFHHSATVALIGCNEAYYTDYLGSPQEFISAAKWGYLYQGQFYRWQKKRRGSAGLDLPPHVFVNYIQNHDQVANSATGNRCHVFTHAGTFRAMTALMLLMPGTPLLFQGQEFAASAPFLFFADQKKELADIIRRGRAEFLSQFPRIATPEVQSRLPDPTDPAAFKRSKLDFSERRTHAREYSLHRDLLRLRREDRVFRAQRKGGVDGAVLGREAFTLRFFGEGGDDRLVLLNLGQDLLLSPAPEPLLAPPENRRWEILWSSEDPRYGGGGTPPVESSRGWSIPGHSAVVLRPKTRAAKRGGAGK